MMIGTLLLCLYVSITNAALMGVSKSNEWCINYISTFTIDFVKEIIFGFVKFFLFNWAVGKQGILARIVIFILSKNETIKDFFEE